MATFSTGELVLVQGLQSKPEHNGTAASVLSFDDAKGRYVVQLVGSGTTLSLKPVNLARKGAGGPTDSEMVFVDGDEAIGLTPEEAAQIAAMRKQAEEAPEVPAAEAEGVPASRAWRGRKAEESGPRQARRLPRRRARSQRRRAGTARASRCSVAHLGVTQEAKLRLRGGEQQRQRRRRRQRW